MDTFTIGDRSVGPDEPTYIIAEAGSNHNGDLDTAKELIDVAADAGADAVKFQTFRAKDLYVDDRELVDDPDDSTYALLESLEQPYEWIPALYDHCEARDIDFISSPFDAQSAKELAEYVPAFKIASFTLSHHPLLEELAEYNKPIIMSTGAHELSEIKEAVEVLRQNGVENLALLHCVSSYPTPLEEINVRAVQTLQQEFDTVIGFSDHTIDPATAPAAAVALGASVVEKHFTLDKDMEGPDHSFAVEPNELNTMISSIRKTKISLGDGAVDVTRAESGPATRSRRGIFAAKNIPQGKVISENSIKVLRPGSESNQGLSPKYLSEIIGSKTITAITKGEPISWQMVK